MLRDGKARADAGPWTTPKKGDNSTSFIFPQFLFALISWQGEHCQPNPMFVWTIECQYSTVLVHVWLLFFLCCSLRNASGSSSGRQRWREWCVWPGPSAQFPELFQPGLWGGTPAAGPWSNCSTTASGHPWSVFHCVCLCLSLCKWCLICGVRMLHTYPIPSLSDEKGGKKKKKQKQKLLFSTSMIHTK